MDYDFLSAVLPTEGKYCAFILREEEGNEIRKNIFVNTIENLHDTVMQHSNYGSRAYFALCTFDNAGTRLGEHALFARSIYFDLDCGWDAEKQKWKAFHTKKDAIQALIKFMADTGLDTLGTPWLNDSGAGVHGYLPLTETVPISTWRPVAELFKKAAKKFGLNIDATVSADAARVLGMPGSMNNKYVPPKPVTQKLVGSIFKFDDIRTVLESHVGAITVRKAESAIMIPGKRLNTEMSAVAKAMVGNSVTYFKNILVRTQNGTGCKQLAYYMEHASDEGMEPLWRAGVLSLAKYCVDGEKAAIRLSALHPYDDDRRIAKTEAIKGPNSCAAIEGASPISCDGCPHQGKITNPLALGRETAVTTTREAPVQDEGGEETRTQLPTPPHGFAYGRKGGVYYQKPAENDDDEPRLVMLLNYDFYMTKMFNDSGEFVGEFVANKEHSTTTFGIPAECLGSAKEITKVLARNNILSVGGMGTDNYLAAYVRGCVQEFSSSGKHVTVPPNLGWQTNGDFVVGNRVISSMGRKYDYTFKSNRLSNVMEATSSKGDLKQWKRVPRMFRDKAIKNSLIWGHCAMTLTGYAATLMCFAPSGAQAGSMLLASKVSGGGKSLVSSVSNSIFGKNKLLVAPPNTSTTTMLQRAGLLGSICLNVDETTAKNRSMSKEWIPTFLYDYSQGVHKIKGSATGNAEIQQNCVWASIALLSSNDPQAESLMSGREHSSLGEMQRFLEWKLPRNWTLELTEDEKEILALLEDHYGVAGPAWIEWLQENMSTAQQRWNEVRAWWCTYANATDNERFWTNMVTSYLTACLLTNPNHADHTDYDFEEIAKFFLHIVKYMRRAIASNTMTATDILDAYTREYINSMSKVSSTGVASFINPTGSTPKNAVRGRVEFCITPDHVDYYLEVRMLKAHCATLGHSYMDFIKELEEAMTITPCRKDLLQGTNNPPLRVQCIRITRSLAEMSKQDQIDALGLT